MAPIKQSSTSNDSMNNFWQAKSTSHINTEHVDQVALPKLSVYIMLQTSKISNSNFLKQLRKQSEPVKNKIKQLEIEYIFKYKVKQLITN